MMPDEPLAGDPSWRFELPVVPGGYRWWYLDGVSDDGEHAVTIIALIGSVFSPYYAWRGRREPWNHTALNVCLYRPGRRGGRWAMTERGQRQVKAAANQLSLGPSLVSWDGSRFLVEIEERGAPLPRRVCGRVTVTPEFTTSEVFELDAQGLHRWYPLAPRARVEVNLGQPELRWSGSGYLDSNWGDEPLERGFATWHWSRAEIGNQALVLYDMQRRDGSSNRLALRFIEDGWQQLDAPAEAQLSKTGIWRVARRTLSDATTTPTVLATLEDTPFYARSLIRNQVAGRSMVAFHESLDLDRFSRNWVRLLLPFRMPRAFF